METALNQSRLTESESADVADAKLFVSKTPGFEALCPERDAEGFHYGDSCEGGACVYGRLACELCPNLAVKADHGVLVCAECGATCEAEDVTAEVAQ